MKRQEGRGKEKNKQRKTKNEQKKGPPEICVHFYQQNVVLSQYSVDQNTQNIPTEEKGIVSVARIVSVASSYV